MAIRIFFSFVFVAIFVVQTCAPVTAQILELPNINANEEVAPIRVIGRISEVKKYSFVISDPLQKPATIEVKVPNGTRMIQRLNSPYFDFDAGKISTLHLGGEEEFVDARVYYDMPSPLYVTMQFNQEKQLERLMSQPKLRLNNYLVTATDIGAQMPTPEKLILKGKLVFKNGQTFVEIKAKKIPVILGMHNAKMDGFSILDLLSKNTEVFVRGKIPTKVTSGTRVVTPSVIEFQTHHRSAIEQVSK